MGTYTSVRHITDLKLRLCRLCVASQVWSPYLQKDIDRLESVQKFALRMCSKQWKVGYHNVRASFGVPSLSDRRLYLREGES